MACTKQEAQAVLDQIATVAEARIRPMMGGYLLYVDEKLIGQIDDGELFFKSTPFGEIFAPDLMRKPPYPGAKPAVVIPAARLSDPAWLREMIVGTLADLKPKK